MFCGKCGQALPENAMFCPQCGSKVEEEPAAETLVSEEANPQPTPAPAAPAVPQPAQPTQPVPQSVAAPQPASAPAQPTVPATPQPATAPAQPTIPQPAAAPTQPVQQPAQPTPAPQPVQQPAQPTPASQPVQPTEPMPQPAQPGFPQQPMPQQPGFQQPMPQPGMPQGAQPAQGAPKKKSKTGVIVGVIAAILAFAVFSGIGNCMGSMMAEDLDTPAASESTETTDVEATDTEEATDESEEAAPADDVDAEAASEYVVGEWMGTALGDGDEVIDLPAGTIMDLSVYSDGTALLDLDGDLYDGTWTNEGYDEGLGHDYYMFNFDDGTQWIGGPDSEGGLMLLDMDADSDYYMVFTLY